MPGENEEIHWTTDAERKANRQPRTMTFTPDDWNVPQAGTIEAESREDDQGHLPYLTHTAHGGGYPLETTELSVAITDSGDQHPGVRDMGGPSCESMRERKRKT